MKKNIVVLGSGGVGKTTVAAALGLGLAKEGSKGAVFTVDPSQRLCQTLGLSKLSLESSLVHNGRVEVYGLEVQNGLKRLVMKAIADPARVERITSHRLFRVIEGNISHLDHFLAMEKIVELMERSDLDFLVIDTPPHDQAFEFFESPQVLSSFLDKSFLKILIEPKITSDALFAKVINKAVDEGWKIFRSFMGDSFWQELATLLQELMPLREKLLQATEKMTAFLKDPNTMAIVVTVPEKNPFAVAEKLVFDWKKKLHLDVQCMVFNKAFPPDVELPRELQGTLLYEKFNLQKELSQSRFYRDFKSVIPINSRAPSEIDLSKLEEIGHELIQSFPVESKIQ